MPAANVLQRLREVVGAGGFIDEPAGIAPYLEEWRGLFVGATALVVRPQNTDEVAALVRICHDTHTPFVPQGGRTGLCGGAVPDASGDAIVLSLERMNRIRAVDPMGYTLTAEAGCVLASIQSAATEVDRLFPLSLAAEGSCQLGGNLATNAGGLAVLRYGTARDLTLGLEVVLPDGRVWDGLRALRKDNTGYALKELFIGAEGTLGVITAAVVKLFPRPRDVQTALIAVPDVDAAVSLLNLARESSGDRVTACELIPRAGMALVRKHIAGAVIPLAGDPPWALLLELSGGQRAGELRAGMENLLESALTAELALDAVLAENAKTTAALWRLRESLSDAQRPEGGCIKHDVAVPVPRVAQLIADATAAVHGLEPTARIVAFGHVGDGNIHFNVLQPEGADKAAFLARWADIARAVHDVTHALGGSISAEHGLGQLKRDEIKHYKSALELELMARVKTALDPRGLANPGKVL